MSIGFVSCNSDNEPATFESPNGSSAKVVASLPENDSNPYDEVGRTYDELFDAYFVNGYADTTVSQIVNSVETLATANSRFNSIKTQNYHNVSSTRVQYLVDHPTTSVNDVITASSMSASGKSNLSNFINSYIDFFNIENDCTSIYNKIVAYENEVLVNAALTANDKRIILTTTSVTRYLTYRARKKPKKNTDPDWHIFIGNIVASIEGAEHGSAEAVTMSLVTGIAQNQ